MNILVLNGPNLNMLGIREPGIYGRGTYEDLQSLIRAHAQKRGVNISFYQSNHEGELVDAIQQAYYDGTDGIIFNPAAYTHTSVALLDALKAVQLPAVEVHLTNVDAREPFRRVSYVGMACAARFVGLGFEGYKRAMAYLIETFSGENG